MLFAVTTISPRGGSAARLSVLPLIPARILPPLLQCKEQMKQQEDGSEISPYPQADVESVRMMAIGEQGEVRETK